MAVCAASLVALAGCTSSGGAGSVVTVTVHRSVAPPKTATTSAAPTTKAPPTPRTLTKLPGTCASLLPDTVVFQAIGVRTLSGNDAFVVGQPEADIGRIGYLNCRYGVTAATPKIEVGISLYKTAAQASTRLKATVSDYGAHGATSTQLTVDGQPATLLTGGTGSGYEVPLLVVASGQRTVAVNVASSVATGAKATRDASSIATLALKNTGG